MHVTVLVSKALARSLFDDLPQGAVDRAKPTALDKLI